MKKVIFVIVFILKFSLFINHSELTAQPAPILNGAELQLALQKLNVLGSVLYVAAHPDDENNALLAYLSKEKKLRTAYLSLTRGSGGQNLIGSEKGMELGILRTQELLAARKIDGAEQFFTRAIDFGYSKFAQESLEKWNGDLILADLVWIIRKFQPDVIITRFAKGAGGHGHHIASAILAGKAFFAAADSSQFQEQLKYVKPWQAKRLVWNTWRPDLGNRTPDMPALISVDLGTYNTLLGKSYTEISALSRSMHKSQGFGSSGHRGSYLNYFEHTEGSIAQEDLFNDIDITWNRQANSSQISGLLKEAENIFNPNTPQKIIPQLLQAYKMIGQLKPSPIIQIKSADIKEVIRSCLGLWLEAISEEYTVSPGDTLPFHIMLVNRSKFPLILKRISFPFDPSDSVIEQPLNNNQPFELTQTIKLPFDAELTIPYWIEKDDTYEINKINDKKLIGQPEKSSPLQVYVHLQADQDTIGFRIPIYYRWSDRVKGEKYRPVEISPPVTINLINDVFLFPDNKAREIDLSIKSFVPNLKGKITIQVPEKWQAQPNEFPISTSDKFEEKHLRTHITPPNAQDLGSLKISAETRGRMYSNSIVEISHDHIPIQVVYPHAGAHLVHFNINYIGEHIAYIMGSGDEIPSCLEQIGYSVDLLSDEDLVTKDLSKYDAIITGTRAYNTRAELHNQKSRLFEYVYKGGTLITLHNTRFGLPARDIGPFPFHISRDRVSDERAPVTFLEPDHPILNWPNKLTQADFSGWVQERGLYFADTWDNHYTALIACNDPGESPKKGGLLYATYGKGHFMYAAYSWFRQLPAGVPGAYRLFINLISAGQK